MTELRLTFHQQGDDWYVQPLSLPDGAEGVSVPLSAFLTDQDYEDLRWYLEDYMDLPDGGSVTRAEGIEKRLDEWGKRLGCLPRCPPAGTTERISLSCAHLGTGPLIG
jgi:hypothetical protein